VRVFFRSYLPGRIALRFCSLQPSKKRVEMPTTCCPLLDEQARRLRNLYDVQLSLMSRDGSATELRAVEYELIRAHRAVKRHRIRCPQCKLNERFMTRWDIRLRPLPSEAPLLPIQVY
jgi:hypothetical protein